MKYSLGLGLAQGVSIIFTAALANAFLILVTLKENFNVSLFVVRMLHSFVFFFSLFYIFIFKPKYDVLYITLAVVIMTHWLLFKNECILSYIEKKLMDKNYKMGDNVFSNPFMDTMFNKSIVYVMLLIQLLVYAFVFYRAFHKSYPRVLVALYVYIAVMFFNISSRFLKS